MPPKTYRSLWLPDLLWVAALGLIATLPFLFSHLDQRLMGCFFRPDAARPWFAESWGFWRFFYTFGPWPALVTGIGALVFLLVGLRRPAWGKWRRQGLLVILTLALGPGLLVNVIFKDHWGRPRPRQTTEFGGRWEYRTVLDKGISGRGKSFPCGHSSMGYFFVAFYFLARHRNKRLALTILAGATVYGTLIGMARMAAGAHFPSDVLWSAFIPAAVGFLLYYVILRIPQHDDAPTARSPGKRPLWLLVAAPLAGLGLLASGLAGTPTFVEVRHEFPIRAPATALQVACSRCDVELVLAGNDSDPVQIEGSVQGFGWPWSKLVQRAIQLETNGMPLVSFSFGQTGHFTELGGRIVIRAPAAKLRTITVLLDNGDLKLAMPDTGLVPDAQFTLVNGDLSAQPAVRLRLSATSPSAGTTVYRTIR